MSALNNVDLGGYHCETGATSASRFLNYMMCAASRGVRQYAGERNKGAHERDMDRLLPGPAKLSSARWRVSRRLDSGTDDSCLSSCALLYCVTEVRDLFQLQRLSSFVIELERQRKPTLVMSHLLNLEVRGTGCRCIEN